MSFLSPYLTWRQSLSTWSIGWRLFASLAIISRIRRPPVGWCPVPGGGLSSGPDVGKCSCLHCSSTSTTQHQQPSTTGPGKPANAGQWTPRATAACNGGSTANPRPCIGGILGEDGAVNDLVTHCSMGVSRQEFKKSLFSQNSGKEQLTIFEQNTFFNICYQSKYNCLPAFLDIPKQTLMNRFSVQWSNSGVIKISWVQVEDSRWSLALMSGHSFPFSSSCAQCSRDCSIPLGSFIQRWSSRPSRRVLSQGTDVTIFLLVIPIQNTTVQAWNWLIAQFESLRWSCWL